jgi:hypothetical protein
VEEGGSESFYYFDYSPEDMEDGEDNCHSNSPVTWRDSKFVFSADACRCADLLGESLEVRSHTLLHPGIC